MNSSSRQSARSSKPTAAKPAPIHTIRMGLVKASIWLNEGSDGQKFHNVTFVRSYNKDDQWHDTTSFGRDDLPLLVKVADAAHSWIYAQPRQKNAQE